jgi:hypothetical protein
LIDRGAAFRWQLLIGVLVHEYVAGVEAQRRFEVEIGHLVQMEGRHARPALGRRLDEAALETRIKLARLQRDRRCAEPRHHRAHDAPLDADLQALHIGEIVNGLFRMDDETREDDEAQRMHLAEFLGDDSFLVKVP